MEKEKIFIVEDDRLITEYLKKILIGLGYKVAGTAVSGEEAVVKIGTSKPNLILMDIRLESDKDGVSTAKDVMDKFDIPVIFTTAYSDPKTLERAKEAFPYGFLVKPYSERELGPAIEMALNRHEHDLENRDKGNDLRKILENKELEITLKFDLEENTLKMVNKSINVNGLNKESKENSGKKDPGFLDSESENTLKQKVIEEIENSQRFKPIYSMKAVTKKTGFEPNLIRNYERAGLIKPYRDPDNNHRMFTLDEIEWLERIYKLIHESGLNIEGIRILLTINKCWEVRNCSHEDHKDCPAYNKKHFPCWHFKHELDCCSKENECYKCCHYVNARRHYKLLP